MMICVLCAFVITNMWLLSIGKAIAIRGWSGQVCRACVSMLQLGGVEAYTPRKILKFRVLLRPFLGPI